MTLLLFTQDGLPRKYIYVYNCNLSNGKPIGKGKDILAEQESQDKIPRHCTCRPCSILMVNTLTGHLGMLPISYKPVSWWKNTHTQIIFPLPAFSPSQNTASKA